MRCSKACEYLSLEMDDLLPPDSIVELRDHLDSCAECRDYRADLVMGQRMLAATEPQLSDNFEWRLQLKLKQTLREAAADSAYLFEEQPDRWSWLRNFGAAAAVGLAAVLALAIFMGPIGTNNQTTNLERPMLASNNSGQSIYGGSDRLSLQGSRLTSQGLNRQWRGQTVSSNSVGLNRQQNGGNLLNRAWTRQNHLDYQAIQRLRAENSVLRITLSHMQKELQSVRAQLDTSSENTLDLMQKSE